MIPLRALECIDIVIGLEGGWVPPSANDPGGATKFGISQRAYPELDIANLTMDDARGIYFRDYWGRFGFSALPVGLDLAVFDCAVNQGPNTAVRLLQKAVGAKEDGVLGPKTLSTVHIGVYDSYMVQRALNYVGNADFPRYGAGWLHRLFLLTQHRPASVSTSTLAASIAP